MSKIAAAFAFLVLAVFAAALAGWRTGFVLTALIPPVAIVAYVAFDLWRRSEGWRS